VTVFFRGILVIPWFIVAMFYGIGAMFAVIAAWFSIVLTGRYPEGPYDFNAGVLRFGARLNGYYYLLTDEFPPFGLGEDPDYPVRVLVEPRKEEYDRLKTLFRIILLIPVAILSYVMSIILQLVGIVSWLVLVFTASFPEGLYNLMRSSSAYITKAGAYYLLLTEDFPPIWTDEPEEAPRFLGRNAVVSNLPAPPAPAV